MRYSNISLFILANKGVRLPLSCIQREIGEGINRGALPDGRAWSKDSFRTPQELRDIVHAEDAGTLQIKTAEEMAVLMPTVAAIDR